MKRDMELARKILIAVEEKAEPGKSLRLENEIEGFAEQEIMYHIQLLAQANLLEADNASSPRRLYLAATNLTWQGHEFLDAIRNETVWNQTKEVVKEKGGSVTFDILKALAVQVAAKHFGL